MPLNLPPVWTVDVKTARQIQLELAQAVRLVPINKNVKNVWAVDVSYNRFDRQGYAVVGVFDVEFDSSREKYLIVSERFYYHIAQVSFPYIPGYLSFREIPVLLPALNQLTTLPDLLLVDGAGIAHPRRVGLATHLGILCQIPTIGCAKSKLIGEYVMPENSPGAFTYLKIGEQLVGIVLRSKAHCRPLFCSPGNLCTLEDVHHLVMAFCIGHRLPEPLRRVDWHSKVLRKKHEKQL